MIAIQRGAGDWQEPSHIFSSCGYACLSLLRRMASDDGSEHSGCHSCARFNALVFQAITRAPRLDVMTSIATSQRLRSQRRIGQARSLELVYSDLTRMLR